MNNINYSVLMSVYYKENPLFLAKSIDSVMQQTIKPTDFVIVCDGPLTPDLKEVLINKKTEYSCINLIELSENQGLGIALSVGLSKTKNEFVMRMDSDDVCLPERAELQIKKLFEYDLVGGWVSEFENDERHIIGVRRVPEHSKEITRFAKKRNPFNHPSVAFNKFSVIDVGGYQDLKFFEDYDLWIRMLIKNKKVYNIQQILVNMRSGFSMRARRGGKEYRKSLKILKKRMLNSHFISLANYLFYTLGQTLFSMLPIKMKEKMYQKILRK